MKTLLLSLMLTLAPALPVMAQDWAIDGFDAVGFLESGRPIPGRGDISTLWKGKVWHFATEENRNRFEADPRSFAPAFGRADAARSTRCSPAPTSSCRATGRAQSPAMALLPGRSRSFAPAFGGLCPVALSEGRRVAGDPHHFVIIENRLYLVGSNRAVRKLQQAPREVLSRARERWKP